MTRNKGLNDTPVMHSLLSTLSVPQLKQAIALREQIDTLESQFAQVLAQSTAVTQAEAPTVKGHRGKRTMSAAARAKIAEAQRARWAKLRRAKVSTTMAAKPKRVISAAGRARIIAATKARWARYRAAKKK